MNARLRDTWRNLDSRGQVVIVGGLLAVIVVVFVLFRIASRPSYTAIQTGIEPAAASEIATALDAAGLVYRIVNGGTQIEVVKGQESRARVALAADGLGTGSDKGLELLAETKLGATEFQQRVNYQRALEGEIARTIEGIDGVSNAQVNLVLPEDELFTEDGTNATAAILLEGQGFIDTATVKGIAHLVSSSVKNLDPKNVTITDSAGALIWPTGDVGGAIGSTSKLEAEQRYSAQLTAVVNAMLAKTLGPNKAEARVHATLNMDQREQESVTYEEQGTPLTVENKNETLTTEGTAPAGAAGTTSNIPGFAGGTAGTGTSNYDLRERNTQFGVDKLVERTVIAPGTVEQLTVALLIDEGGDEAGTATGGADPAEQVVAVREAVKSLVGFDEQRGDTISTATIPFAEPPEEVKPASPVTSLMANPLGLLKWVGLAVGSLIFLFLMRRGLKRREAEQIAPEPTWLRQIEGAMPIAQLGSGMSRELTPDPIREQRDLSRAEVEEIVKLEPERVATQVSQWMRE
jgi:flagellar M-ring protein FliF